MAASRPAVIRRPTPLRAKRVASGTRGTRMYFRLWMLSIATAVHAADAVNWAPPPPSMQLVATQLQTLISINATMAAPARDIKIRGVGFRDAADVTMEPWGVPSGGDWGLYVNRSSYSN